MFKDTQLFAVLDSICEWIIGNFDGIQFMNINMYLMVAGVRITW